MWKEQSFRHRTGIGLQRTGALCWVKKGGGQALSWLRGQRVERLDGAAGQRPVVVVACDEMWTYWLARHRERR